MDCPRRCVVVVVDDDRDTVDSNVVLLQHFGHEAYAAYDGVQAIEAAKRVKPDVVFIDLGMPGMSGFAVARAIRATADGKEIKLVAYTGYGTESDRVNTLAQGFDMHLVKPMDPCEMQGVLNRLYEPGLAA